MILKLTVASSQLTVIAGTFYYPAIITVKLSVFLLYLRLFSPNVRFRWMVYIGIIYNLVANTTMMISIPVACSPRDNQGWVREFQSMDCYQPLQNIAIASSVLNLTSDVYILLLPIPMIWALHLPIRKRVGVMTIFATGSLYVNLQTNQLFHNADPVFASACAGSLAGLVIRGKYNGNTDFAYYTNLLTITSVIELNIGLICACMPASAAILRKIPSPNLDRFYNHLTKPLKPHNNHAMAGIAKPDLSSRSSSSRYLELGLVENLNSKETLMMQKSGSVGVISKSLDEGGKQSDGDEEDDNEKGKVGFNRAWYPG
ncbi:MAG: hypothetical protein Q9182_002936 [Xanthomendoza sp. 2 TL-2023]